MGKPNAGKSTLMNLLAKKTIAIVSPIPGTTRDLIEVKLDIHGMPCIITDTAGIRVLGDVSVHNTTDNANNNTDNANNNNTDNASHTNADNANTDKTVSNTNSISATDILAAYQAIEHEGIQRAK